MMRYNSLIPVCLALALAACGGEGDLSVDLPGRGEERTLWLEFPPGQAVERELPFRVSGGVAPYTSSIDGCPDWVTLFPDQGVLAGSAPEAESGRTFFCTYQVTDSGGFLPPQSATYGLRLEVRSPAPVSLTLPVPDKVSLSVGSFSDTALPEAADGVGPYTYSFACAGGSLPSGMGFAPATRRLAGTPDARFRDSCTYTVTDSSRPAATESVAVEVEVTGGALTLPGPGKVTLTVGSFSDRALPEAAGGIGPYTYSFACAGGSMPSGMGFAPATRRLAGTPDARFRDTCTYTVTDSARPAETVSQAVEVEVTGGALTLPGPGKVTLTVGSFSDTALPEAAGGVGPYTYSFACAGGSLPSGVGFAPVTRRLAGTPDARFRDTCTYTATDSARSAATRSVAVEVEVSGPALELPPVLDQSLNIGVYHSIEFPPASGGVAPHTDSYTYSFTCAGGALPAGTRFSPATRVFAGTPDAAFQDSCTYTVTDSAQPAASVSRAVEVKVDPLDLATWRFRTRTVEPGGPCTLPNPGTRTSVAILPHAQGGEAGYDVYRPIDFPEPENHFLHFDRKTRQLTYIHPPAVPILGTPNTYRYLVGDTRDGVPDGKRTNTHDVLCLDIQFDPGTDICPDPAENYIHIHLRVRDDAFLDGNTGEYRCPDTTAPAPRSVARSVSNPVHTALAPIHARRAVDAAHGTVRDLVRRWRPGAPRPLSAVAPAVGIGSLSGRSEGFDYTGSSESLSVGAELGAGSWQAGLVAAFTRTDLRYRAEPDLSSSGYRAGEHDTEIFSVHPFAAWHVPSGAKLWASLGAGTGELRHRDDAGFPSRSRSDVRFLAHAVGASALLTDLLSGELRAEAGIESFALEIEGGGQISSTLPTLRGHDYRAGLAWSAPIAGAPSLSVAYKHLTGDGPEGGRLETEGSVSFQGFLDPRLGLTGSAEVSFGLGDHEHDSWGLGGGLRFAPGGSGRGFGLDLDTRLLSAAGGVPSGIGIRGEAGYGLWGGRFLGTIRPHVGAVRHSGDGSVRRSLGFDLRDTPNSRIGLEVHDRSRDRSRGVRFTLRHRF